MEIKIDSNKVKQMIFEKNLNIDNIVRKTDISRSQLYNIISGNQEMVFERTAFKLSHFLKCTVSDLMDED